VPQRQAGRRWFLDGNSDKRHYISVILAQSVFSSPIPENQYLTAGKALPTKVLAMHQAISSLAMARYLFAPHDRQSSDAPSISRCWMLFKGGIDSPHGHFSALSATMPIMDHTVFSMGSKWNNIRREIVELLPKF